MGSTGRNISGTTANNGIATSPRRNTLWEHMQEAAAGQSTTKKKRSHSEKKELGRTQINTKDIQPAALFEGDTVTPPGQRYKVDQTNIQNLVNVMVAGDNRVEINQEVTGYEMAPAGNKMMRTPPPSRPSQPDPYLLGNADETGVPISKIIAVTPQRNSHKTSDGTEAAQTQDTSVTTENNDNISLATDATDALYTPTPEKERRARIEANMESASEISQTDQSTSTLTEPITDTTATERPMTNSHGQDATHIMEIEEATSTDGSHIDTTQGNTTDKRTTSSLTTEYNNTENNTGRMTSTNGNKITEDTGTGQTNQLARQVRESSNIKEKSQSTIPTPRIIFHKYKYRILISLYVVGEKVQVPTSLAGKGKVLQMALKNVIRAGKAIDEKFVINAWNPDNKIPTLTKENDVNQIYLHMIRYTDIPPRSKIMIAGVCWFWGFYISCDTSMKRFLHYWEEQRPKRADEKRISIYQAVKPAPLQTPKWFEAGWILGSTRLQYIDTLVSKLQEESPAETIGLHWGNIVYPGSKVHWSHAKDTFRRNRNYQEKMDLSPMAFIVMVSKRSDVRPTMNYMYEKYGRLEANGMWPRFPDGSRMRYTPNYNNVKGIKGKKMFEVRVRLQIQMNWSKQLMDTQIRDPGEKLDCLNNKTIGEAILACECNVGNQTEPHFRHFSHKWSQNPDARMWEICIHPHRYREAAAFHSTTMRTHLIDEYGAEVVSAFIDQDSHTYADAAGEANLGFDLDDDDDIYMSGKTKFKFHGILDTVDKDNRGKSMQELQTDADDSCAYTANTRTNNNTQQSDTPSTPVHSNHSQNTHMEVDNEIDTTGNNTHTETSNNQDIHDTTTSMSTQAHGGR